MTDTAPTAPTASTARTAPTARPTNAILGSALAASVLTLAGTLYQTNQRDLTFVLPPTQTFGTAFGLAALPVLVYLLVLIGAGYLGWLRTWWQGLAAGAAGVLLGGVIGYAVQIVAGGLPLDGTAWAAIFGEFLGLNFPFTVSGLIAASLLAPAVHRGLAGEAPRATARTAPAATVVSTSAPGSAFLRIPSDALLESLDEADADAANAQWEALVEVFEQHGWGTQAVPAAPHEAESVLVGDLALVLGEQVVLARPKGDERRAELAGVRETLLEAGAVIDELEAPAVFDPADVVAGEGVLYVGAGATTNAAGIRGLRRLVAPRGYRVVAVPVRNRARLSEALSVLPDGTLLAWAEGLDAPGALGGFVAVPEPRGAAVVALDERTIAVPASAPETEALLGRLGYETVAVDVSALERAGGALPRLSLRSRD
ncbi:MAG: hypothetical protein GXX90_07150 [Microbacteriaceae bacterium]|nr:hypothetical protein [Microbacteriaceae bacterium]